jgi:hypothetical protein
MLTVLWQDGQHIDAYNPNPVITLTLASGKGGAYNLSGTYRLNPNPVITLTLGSGKGGAIF